MRIYLDHNATTPPSAAVVDRMAATLREEFGNPSSVHHFGQRAKARHRRGAVGRGRADRRRIPAKSCSPAAGPRATTSRSAAWPRPSRPTGRKHLIASAIEHEAVLNTLKALARRGWKTTLLPVDESGIVSPDALAVGA